MSGNLHGLVGEIRSAACRRALATLAGSLLLWTGPAAAQTTAYNSLTLLWVAPGDDGSQGQVSSYQLRYSTAPVGSDTTGWWNGIPPSQRLVLGPPLAAAGAQDSTKVTGLTEGTTYYFVLRALDEALNISGFSNVAVGTTASCNAPTSPPPSFGASADSGAVTVAWGGTTDPLAVSIRLYRALGTTGAWNLIQTLPTSATGYVDTSVNPGATYRYRAAYMGTLCEGPTTAVVTVTLPGSAAPPPPTAASTIHAYPNPAGASLQLVLHVEAAAAVPVSIKLFDLTGRWIATLVDGSYPPGDTEVHWNRLGRDGRTVAPGYYEVLGTVGNARVRDRLVLLP